MIKGPRSIVVRALVFVLAFTGLTSWSVMTVPGFTHLRLAGRRPSSGKVVKAAQEAVEKAFARRKTHSTKEVALATDAALERLEAATASRVREITSRLRQLDDPIRPAGRSPTVDDLNRTRRTVPREVQAETDLLMAELERLKPARLYPQLIFPAELEPNDTPDRAVPLNLTSSGYVTLSGSILAGDQDYFKFNAPAGSRVWAFVDTGGPQRAGATSRDSQVTILGPDGGKVLAVDDDSGFGGASRETGRTVLASAIAGLSLSEGGTYFIRINAESPAAVIDPYRLFVAVSTSSSVEIEPNDKAEAAELVATATDSVGVRSAKISAAGDVDYYSVASPAGWTIYASLHANPDGDGTVPDLIVDLLAPDGNTMLFSTDAGRRGDVRGPATAMFGFDVSAAGNYLVRVRNPSGTTGSYDLLAVTADFLAACPPASITSTFGSPTAGPGYFVGTGTQTDRLFRNLPASTCAAPKACPATVGDSLTRAFDAYTFTNTSCATACVTVSLTQNSGIDFALFTAAYLGSYNPVSLCTNYLGDPAGTGTIGLTEIYSFDVPSLSDFVIIVHEVDPGDGTGANYTLAVSGPFCCEITCPANITQANAPNQCDAVVAFPAPTTNGSCGTVTCTPASGSTFPVGTTTVTCTTCPGGRTCSFTVQVQQRLVLEDDANGNCIVVTRDSCASGEANYCWKRANNTTVSGACTMSVEGTNVYILTAAGDPNPWQGGANLMRRTGWARSIAQRGSPTTLVLKDSNIDDSACICP
ncbi:MAG: PPC domain-containing protein [Acidobacteria bacterium]|nr:PPC domain-containing protein [Acidobacteriota bacterium]